ncbi:MAG: Fic family protein [Rhodospirillales bacterium]|nr:Fic family protein [Rhodospirillales bacterium]
MRLELAHSPHFQESAVPDETRLAGWTALVKEFSIEAPVRQPSCVSEKHIKGSQREERNWQVFDKRYWPGDSFADHLTFAFRHETLDLLILKRIFDAVPDDAVEELVRAAPTGVPARRIWYFYELLTGKTLDLPDAQSVAAIDLLDPAAYFTSKPRLSKRHRVRDNLLGTVRFCPLIRRTKALEEFIGRELDQTARETVGRTGAHLVARAASFMLLADSRASFEIEGERPPRSRLERWGRAIMQAGRNKLTVEEIVRLHQILIEDTRFIQPGLRREGVFLGERDHNYDPLPEFIGARPEDLPDLVGGLIDANDRMSEAGIDPVLQSTATAFGFVYVHPLQDGNGRLHRCLIHHVLAERKFTPPGMVFPVSSVMLDRIDSYRTTLQADTGPLMPFIEWRPTPDRNVEVLNDTADLYRYFDYTSTAEFLYGCVRHTVEHDLPREIEYLRRHDEALRRVMDTVEMPDRLAENLIMFVRQNGGSLSKKRRQSEFEALTDVEVAQLEAIVREAFDGFAEAS